MFRLRLVLQKKPECWVFRVGYGFRIANVLIAGVAGLGAWSWNSFGWGGVLVAVALLAALYEESARFDRARGRAEFRWGLLLLHRTKHYPLDEVVEVRTSSFEPGRFSSLQVVLRDGTLQTIENDRGKTSCDRLMAWARQLSDWLEVPLHSD